MKTSLIYSLALVALFFVLGACGPDQKKSTVDEDTSAGFNSIFFDIHGNKVPAVNSDSVTKLTTSMKDIDLRGSSDFWPDHDHFFMNSIGSITFPASGAYSFRMHVKGKITFRINNKDVFRTRTPADTTMEKTQYVDAGPNMFEIEYFDAGLDPEIALEYAAEGKELEKMPAEMFGRADLALPPEPYEQAAARPVTETNQLQNTLSNEEKKAGWQLLFDGKSTKGWHTYNHPGTIGSKWRAEDGTLMFDGRKTFRYTFEGRMVDMGETHKDLDGGLDIVTDDEFENFELALEWKISEGGNSGIFYTVLEDPKYDEGWKTSPEMQVLDDHLHKDGLIYKHRAGDLYDLIACKEIAVRPQGEWNAVKVIKKNGAVEHWLNGVKVVEYNMTSPEWKEMIKKSKFADLKDFATPGKRKMALQDHDCRVWFRNLKIRRID